MKLRTKYLLPIIGSAVVLLLGIWITIRPPIPEIVDTAIIGGGISGIYAAYRLEGDRTIALFEANPHLGGRILTLEVPDANGFRVELGAMRFMKKQKICMV